MEINNIIALHMEGIYYSAFTIINSSCIYSMFLGAGILSGISIVTAKHMGAGNSKNAIKAIIAGVVIIVLISVVMLVVFYFLRYKLIPLYSNIDAVLQLSYKFSIYSLILIIPLGVCTVLMGALKGLGKQGITSIYNFISLYVVQLGLELILVFKYDMKIEGIYLAMFAACLLSIGLMAKLLLSYDYNTLKLEALARIIQESHGWDPDQIEEKKLLQEEDADISVSTEDKTKFADSLFDNATNNTIANSK